MEPFAAADDAETERQRLISFAQPTYSSSSGAFNFCSCCRPATGLRNMTLFKRCCLLVFLFQFGCLAVDHSISELEYEEDDLRLIGGGHVADPVSLGESSDNGFKSSEAIRFQPNSFDFLDCPVGMPRLGVVRVFNRLTTENLILISISGNNVNFHSSFFAEKVIGPGNDTSFEIVFLSREEGYFESVLCIHTSKGLFNYQVSGRGLPNPYRLRPLVGAVIPVNASYEPVITIHNPHETPLVVVEMLSSGSDFSLRLPDDTSEHGDSSVWAIEPFQTKPVMQGSFQGRTEGNHSGFIRIKVNHTALSGEYLMVPVEVQVSSSPGIYSPQDSLSFGFMVQSDKPKTLSLSLINAQAMPVNVLSVSVRGEHNAAIRIEFRPVVVEPGISASTVVALVTFDPSVVTSVHQTSGYIEVRSDSGNSITIPFSASVLEGELQYNSSSLGFYVMDDGNSPRNVSVRNTFSTAVAIYDVNVNFPEIVKLDTLNQSQLVLPGEQKYIFALKVKKREKLCQTDVFLTVKSNVTTLRLPVSCYDGKLQLLTLEGNMIDFGRIDLYSSHTEYFAVENPNPVEIRLKSWGSNSTWSQVDLVGMQRGAKTDLPKIRDFDTLKKSLFLQPGYMAVFSVEIRRPTVEGTFFGESYLITDHNQTIRIPFVFSVSKGNIYSEPILFDKVFPGKISTEKFFLTSSFNHTLTVIDIRSHPPLSVSLTPQSARGSEILPFRKTFLGKLQLDVRKFCNGECYSGFPLESSLGSKWIHGSKLYSDTSDYDRDILDILQRRFAEVKDGIISNVSLWVDTNELAGFKVKARLRYIWPRLSSIKMLVFPLTALENEAIMDIQLVNPSISPVVIQATTALQYGSGWTKFSGGDMVGGNSSEGNLVFSITGISSSSSQDNFTDSLNHDENILKLRSLGFLSPLPGEVFILPAGAKYFLSIRFKPFSKDMVNSMLLLRNNLTGMETVTLKGRAGTGQLTVGSGVPGSSLLFQLTEKLLKGCENESSSKYVPPQLTVRRSFVARNVGEIPLEIVTLGIYPQQRSFWGTFFRSTSGHLDSCEGYGFRILNCHPFILQPNRTHSVDIAFTPDFTLSRVVRSLRLTDSTGGQFNYSLVALIPSGMLTVCASIITRPTWESYLKILLAFGTVICILAAAMMAYFEAGSVVSSTVVATVRVLPKDRHLAEDDPKDKGQKLDLKAVYEKVENRFKRNQEAQKSNSSGGNKQQQQQKHCVVESSNNTNPSSFCNLRQRRSKKNCSSSSNNSDALGGKLSDKIFTATSPPQPPQPLVVSRNCNTPPDLSKAVSKFVSEEKEQQSKSCSTSSTTPTAGKKDRDTLLNGIASGGKKKKTVCSQPPSSAAAAPAQASSGGKSKKSLRTGAGAESSVDKLVKLKTEEETSSTTTESSNPDEFNVSYVEKRKESSGEGGLLMKTKSNSSERRGGDRKAGSPAQPDPGKMSAAAAAAAVAEEKAGRSKSRTWSGNSSSSSSCRVPERAVGVKSSESLVWETPPPLLRPSEGSSAAASGLQEMKSSVARKLVSSGEERCLSAERKASSPVATASQGSFSQLANSGGFYQPKPKRPGVIGQPRLQQQQQQQQQGMGGTNNSYCVADLHHLHHQQHHNGGSFVGSSGLSLSMGGGNSSAARANTVWQNVDVLPDNGCDIWVRRAESGSPSGGGICGGGGGRSSSTLLRSAGFQAPQSTSGYCANSSAQTAATYHHHQQQSQRSTPYYFSNQTGEEVLSALWNVNGEEYQSGLGRGFEGMVGGRAAAMMGGRKESSSSAALSAHGYLQRMRTELPREQRASGNSWTESFLSEGRHDSSSVLLSQGSDNNYNKLRWISPGPSTMDNNSSSSHEQHFEEWRSAEEARRLSQAEKIWNTNVNAGSSSSSSAAAAVCPVASQWGSYESPTAAAVVSSSSGGGGGGGASLASDNLAVGSGSRAALHEKSSSPIVGPLTDIGIRNRSTNISQNLREVEAGLGFNPFRANIWDSADGPSWASHSFGYSSNE